MKKEIKGVEWRKSIVMAEKKRQERGSNNSREKNVGGGEQPASMALSAHWPSCARFFLLRFSFQFPFVFVCFYMGLRVDLSAHPVLSGSVVVPLLLES